MTQATAFLTHGGQAPGFTAAESLCLFRYPMGDITVAGQAEDPSLTQVFYYPGTATPDWTLIAMWADTLKAQGVTRRVLILPYLPGARGDKDTPATARVNATLAAATGITHLITVDPHSPVWLDEFTRAAPEATTVVLPLGDIVGPLARAGDIRGIIAPDEGARGRATEVAQAAGGLPVAVASKVRDQATGRLSNYEITLPEEMTTGPLLAVDDICDGGGTFMLLMESLPADIEVDLWVTHGGFTKGTTALSETFRTIYTTDSIYSTPLPGASVDVTTLLPHFARLISTITP